MSIVPSTSTRDNSTGVSTRSNRRKDGTALLESGRFNRTRSGETFDRSVPLTRADARRFMAVVATLDGFADVEAMPTKHAAADGKTWFVRWHRVSVSPPMLSSATQEVRAERALHQFHEMEWLEADDAPDSTSRYCLHHYPDSDAFGLYLVSFDRCGCPDYDYRMGRIGGKCKHIQALRMHLHLPLEPARSVNPRFLPPETEEEKAERKERVKRDFALDF